MTNMSNTNFHEMFHESYCTLRRAHSNLIRFQKAQYLMELKSIEIHKLQNLIQMIKRLMKSAGTLFQLSKTLNVNKVITFHYDWYRRYRSDCCKMEEFLRTSAVAADDDIVSLVSYVRFPNLPMLTTATTMGKIVMQTVGVMFAEEVHAIESMMGHSQMQYDRRMRRIYVKQLLMSLTPEQSTLLSKMFAIDKNKYICIDRQDFICSLIKGVQSI